MYRCTKGLGFATRKFITWEDYPICVRLKITPAKAKKISCDNDPNTNVIYLYDDERNPVVSKKNMQDYLARLEILAHLRIDFK